MEAQNDFINDVRGSNVNLENDAISSLLVEIAETKVSYILAWSAKIYMQLDLDLQINRIKFI